MSLPTHTPSTRKSTRVTPTSSEAFAWRKTTPATAAPLAGEVMAVVGALNERLARHA